MTPGYNQQNTECRKCCTINQTVSSKNKWLFFFNEGRFTDEKRLKRHNNPQTLF